MVGKGKSFKSVRYKGADQRGRIRILDKMSEVWVQVSAMTGKEYFITYYENHKEEYLKRNRNWRKNNPKKKSKNNKKYYKKWKRKKSINKSKYSGTSLKELYIKRYGRDLEKTKDNATLTEHKKRIFCVDCIHYRRGKIQDCPGWEKCKYKEEILEIINEK